MYAIVEIAGHQYKVEKDQQVFVNRLDAEEGKKVKFDRVLLVDNGKDVQVGAPAVSGAEVTAQVERHLKGDKVLVFKKKRRKGYQKLNGFRASLTEIKITAIKAGGAKKAAPKAAAEDKPATEKKAAAKKPIKRALCETPGSRIAQSASHGVCRRRHQGTPTRHLDVVLWAEMESVVIVVSVVIAFTGIASLLHDAEQAHRWAPQRTRWAPDEWLSTVMIRTQKSPP